MSETRIKYEVGDLVKLPTGTKCGKSSGVVISNPVMTPTGATVRIAVGDKIMSYHTWSLEVIEKSSKDCSSSWAP